MKKIIAMMMVLAMALSLCACGGAKPAETEAAPTPVETEAAAVVTEAPETEAPAEEQGGYAVTVLDESGAPIAGAMVQLCKDACIPSFTDAEGVARFALPEDTYKVSFVMLPEGYTYVDDVQEFYFEAGSMEMTITLKAAE